MTKAHRDDSSSNSTSQDNRRKADDSASMDASNPEAESREASVVDRRSGLDRRSVHNADSTNLERRRGPGRRRTDFMKAAEEGEMTQEQFMFVLAIDTFKQVNNKTFPTWTDVLEVIRKLGYRKTQPSELNLGRHAEDWIEKPDAPSGVHRITHNETEAA